mgnify:CR=1 FL=1
MAESIILPKVKLALRVTTNAFDTELSDLIESAKADLGIVAQVIDETDPLTAQAIITYCKCNFGEPNDYDRLKKSYDEQKAQMRANPAYKED